MNGIPQVLEWTIVRHDGTVVDTEVSLSLGVTSETNYVRISVRDISERKKAQESLRLFRLLVDQSNDSIQVVDFETMRLLDVNASACSSLGYTREELLSLHIYDVDPTDRRTVECKSERRIAELGRSDSSRASNGGRTVQRSR